MTQFLVHYLTMSKIQLSNFNKTSGTLIYAVSLGIFLGIILVFHNYLFIVLATVFCIVLYTLQVLFFLFVAIENHFVISEGVFAKKKSFPIGTIVDVCNFFPLLGIVKIRFKSGENVYFLAQPYRKVKFLLNKEGIMTGIGRK